MRNLLRYPLFVVATLLWSPVSAAICDVDNDSDVDFGDISLIFGSLGQPAEPGDPRDADQNGFLDATDVQLCVQQCTLASCASPPPPGNATPVAEAGPDQTAFVTDTVTLDASGSTDADGDSLTYSWSFVSRPAGSSATLSDTTALMPSFSVDAFGEYVVQLIVDDGEDDSTADSVSISTLNSPPQADAGPDLTAFVTDTATLDGSGSSDVDGNALTFAWSVIDPDGNPVTLSDATAVMPTFIVTAPGTYLASLVVNDGTVSSAADSVLVTTENSAPVADAGSDRSVFVTDTVTLNGNGSSDVDGDLLAFFWSFTSVPTDSLATLSDPEALAPSFLVDLPGEYVAQLIVNDGTADSTPDTVVISTQNSPPVANPGADQSVFVTDVVTLDGTGSSDVDGDLLTFSWSLTSQPAGSAATLNDLGAVSPSFTVDLPGDYVAQLLVNDGTVDSQPATVVISTLNSAPTANAGADQSVFVTDEAILDGAASLDVDGDPLTFSWSLTSAPAGSSASLDDPSIANPRFTVDLPGDYVAQLVVNDGLVDSIPDTIMISTLNSAPVAAAGPDQAVLAGTVVSLDASASGDVDGDGLGFSWSLTSAPAGSTAVLVDPDSENATFTPDLVGSYLVQLIVNDGMEDSQADTMTITALNNPPVADAGADRSVAVYSTVTLDASGSSDLDGDVLGYAWTLVSTPAGSTAALSDSGAVNPSFVADIPGDYTLGVTVNDGEASSQDEVVITVTNAPPTANAGADLSVPVTTQVFLDGTGSSDLEGPIASYSWSLTSRPANSLAVLNDPASETPFFVADRSGVYELQLVVNDGFVDSTPDPITVVTVNTAPVAIPGSDQSVQPGDTVSLDGSGSIDVDDDILTYQWTLTAPAESSAALSDAASATPTFVADVAGDYAVSLVVNDGTVDSPAAALTVTAAVPQPNRPPEIVVNTTVENNGSFFTVTLDASGTTDPDGNTFGYTWQSVSGPAPISFYRSASQSDPQFFPSSSETGTYVVRLTVTETNVSNPLFTVQEVTVVVE